MKMLILLLVSTLFYGCTIMQESMKAPAEDAISNEETTNGYIPFEKSAYLKAKDDGKVIFLEFYANWCPDCARQEPQIKKAFEGITDVAGFRVNYKDSDTDQDEIDLAREFGITYQHTHIIINENGEVVTRSQEFWDDQRIQDEIAQVK